MIIKALSGKTDVKFFLKLVGRNQAGTVYSTLPNACVLAKGATAETKPSALNFVALDKSLLQFSNYELTQMKNYKNAKPTDMGKKEDNPDTAGDDVDLDNIDLDV